MVLEQVLSLRLSLRILLRRNRSSPKLNEIPIFVKFKVRLEKATLFRSKRCNLNGDILPYRVILNRHLTSC